MQVIKTSFESTIHNVCADLVHAEMEGLKRFSIGSIVAAPAYAITARVVAVAAHAFWIGNEVVLFLPRMICITVGLSMDERASFSRSFFQQSARVYGLYFQTMCAQFAVGSLACIVPEFSHYLLELHKPLFALQLDLFIHSLPSLPHVQKDIRKSYGAIDSVAQLYQRVGLADDEWRQAITSVAQGRYSFDVNEGPKYLSTDSSEFQETFKQTLFSYTAFKLNEKYTRGEFTRELVNGLHPNIWKHIVEYLEPGAQFHLIELLQENIIDHEINPHFRELYKLLTGFDYCEPKAVAVLRLMPEKMREAAANLIATGVYTKDQVEDYYSALSPMMLDGIVRLLDGARLPDLDSNAIIFNTPYQQVTFTQDYQFFGVKPMLLDLKKELLSLTADERIMVYQLCCDTNGVVPTPAARHFFEQLVIAKMEFFDRRMGTNDNLDANSSVDWGSAFSL